MKNKKDCHFTNGKILSENFVIHLHFLAGTSKTHFNDLLFMGWKKHTFKDLKVITWNLQQQKIVFFYDFKFVDGHLSDLECKQTEFIAIISLISSMLGRG